MNTKRQDLTFSQLRQQIFYGRLMIAALSVILCTQVFFNFYKQEKTIIVPPERSRYILEEFSPEYLEGFIYFWTKTLFDYCAQNCSQRIESMASHLSNSQLLEKLERENALIVEKSLEQTFFPKSVTLDQKKATLKGFIQRQCLEHGKIIKEVEIVLTYQQGPFGAPLLCDWSLTTLSREHCT